MKARELAKSSRYDAVVVGSGPNGFGCAIALQQSGCSVLMIEAQATLGGGCRTAELTLPGFKHDICASVLPMGMGSPFFRTLPLEQYGLRWIVPEGSYVHAYAPGEALVVDKDLNATAKNWTNADSYCDLMSGLMCDWDELCSVLLEPPHLVRHPLAMAKFGSRAMLSANALRKTFLSGPQSQAVFGGVAAHAAVPLDGIATAALGLSLAIVAHAVGWPLPEGGAGALTNALYSHFTALGGEVITECPIESLDDLPPCRFLFFDLTPKQFVKIAGDALQPNQQRRYEGYKYGPSVYKLDWALSRPIPWSSPDFLRAPTVHIGGTFEDIAFSESRVWQGGCDERPFVLLVQPTTVDATRAPEGKHVVWAYSHVPYLTDRDYTDIIESRIEEYAPGFKDAIIGRSKLTPARFESLNANHVGGDINGGTLAFSQLLLRPTPRLIPYKTALPNVYLCSSSTPPGSGVHGMAGYWAAWFALQVGSKGRWAVPYSASGSDSAGSKSESRTGGR